VFEIAKSLIYFNILKGFVTLFSVDVLDLWLSDTRQTEIIARDSW